MAKQEVDIGVEGNDGTGDSIRESFRKVNENFNELYAVFGAGGQISFTNLGDTPSTIPSRQMLISDDAGTLLQFAEIGSDTDEGGSVDSVIINYDIPGKIILKTNFRKVFDDFTPVLGGPLNAFGQAIANVKIDADAVNDYNDTHTGSGITIDDLVITKGYADARYIAGTLPIRVSDEPPNADEYTLNISRYTNGNIEIPSHGFDRTINGTPYTLEVDDNSPTLMPATLSLLYTGQEQPPGPTQDVVIGRTYKITAPGNIDFTLLGARDNNEGTQFVATNTLNATSQTESSATVKPIYYLRFYNTDQLSVFYKQADAKVQNLAQAESLKINVTHIIADEDSHSMLDAGYDPDLEGFFLANEAMPRKSIVRRQGDAMTGPLVLHDSPGELAGLTNDPLELQAATKFYVDNTSYSSPTNLFVSTKGDDKMRGVPAGKEGTALSYAYASINAAAQRADEIIRASEAEPGPYMQTIQKNGVPVPVIEYGFNNPVYDDTRQLIAENREFIIREISAYLKFKYPNFTYNIETCERDLGLILDSVAFDIVKSLSEDADQNNANSLTRKAAERYYANSSGRIAITRQYTETIDAIETAKDIVAAILLNRPYRLTPIANITNGIITTVATTNAHGLSNGNIVVISDVTNLTALNDNFYYVKVQTNNIFELFEDEALTIPVNTSTLPDYNLGGGQFGVVYQTDNKQYFNTQLSSPANARTGVNDKFDLIVEILTDGIDAGTVTNFGRTYNVVVDSGVGATDQGDLSNRDVLPGKVLVGKISGAQGRIVSYTAGNDDTSTRTDGADVIEVHLLKPIDFIAGEDLEFGNFVNRSHVTIFIESGQYQEDYPIKVPANVSIKGDEFRRVIIRPKDRVSQSKWANTYIYRDKYFDGLTTSHAGYRFYNQTNEFQGYFGYHYLTNPEKPVNTGVNIVNAGNKTQAAAIIKENKKFIQEEIIQYINNNVPELLYDHAQFDADLNEILNFISYDIPLDSNYKSVTEGLKFQRSKSIYRDEYLRSLWVLGLQDLKLEVLSLPQVDASVTAESRIGNAIDTIVDIIQNGSLDTNSASPALYFNPTIGITLATQTDARDTLQANREFIAQEGLAKIKSLAPKKYINDAVRLRDYRDLVDALTYDIMYGGNSAIIEYAKALFIDNELRFEITTRQESLQTLTHLAAVIDSVLQDAVVAVTTGNAESQSFGNGLPPGAAELTNISDLIDIVYNQINFNSLLTLPTRIPPGVTGADTALQGAQSEIFGAVPSLQVSTKQTIDASIVFNYNVDKCRRDVGLIVNALVNDLIEGGFEKSLEVQGQYYDSYIVRYNNGGFGGQENVTKNAIGYIATVVNQLLEGEYPDNLLWQDPLDADYVEPDFKYGTGEVGVSVTVDSLIEKINFAFSRQYNPPKRNDQMDCFLMNDATILRNMTVQGHGGFMVALDPEGQILTKSPYVQTGSSFSKSINAKTFAGGMFVDAYVGNMPVYIPETIQVEFNGPILPGKTNNFELWIRSEEGQGLFIREPQLPCPFYIEGRRYQVNAISNYSQSNGWAKIYLDKTSNNGDGYDETQFDENVGQVSRQLFLQTAGNRSMLGNDFTQINDLGYALVTTNGAFSEMVSMFTYYCHAAYYAANGSEIRSLNGSNGYGNFGLVAEGADPNEIPDQVVLEHDMAFPAKTVTFLNGAENTNIKDSTSLFVTDMRQPPNANSIVQINHPTEGTLRYRIGAVTKVDPATFGVTITGSQVNANLYRLQITGEADGENGDFYSAIRETIPDGTYIEYRNSVNHKFNGVRNQLTLETRPSTAINFDESDDITYRSVSFAYTDNFGTDADTDSVFAQFDVPYDYVTLPVNGDGFTGGKGSVAGDYKVAIKRNVQSNLISDSDFTRLVYDVAGNTPPVSRVNENGALRIASNIKFVAAETIEYANTLPGLTYDEITCYRDVQLILHAVVNDILHGGNAKTVIAAKEYFERTTDLQIPSDQIAETVQTLVFARDLVMNNILTGTPYSGTNGTFSQDTVTGGVIEANVDARVNELMNIITDALTGAQTDVAAAFSAIPAPTGYSGGMIFAWDGRTHQIINVIQDDTSFSTDNMSVGETYQITELRDSDWNAIAGTSNVNYQVGDVITVSVVEGSLGNQNGLGINVNWKVLELNPAPVVDITLNPGAGINTALPADKVFYAGLQQHSTAEITVSISLCRATGHDFTQIGTGGFNTSNYPNVILGPPVGIDEAEAPFHTTSPDATKAQVWERRKGRVFWMSTDQYGFFRVGQFFSVDQAQGSIEFSGEIGITGANAIGFKKGVPVDEFSVDDTMGDNSDSAVPVEQAIVGYINKRLGRDKNNSPVSGKIGPGFLDLAGASQMEGPIQMGNNRVINVGTPTQDSDAATKQYVDAFAAGSDSLDSLRNFSTNNPLANDLMAITGAKVMVTTPPVDSSGNQTLNVGNAIETVAGAANATIVDIITETDALLGNPSSNNIIWNIYYVLDDPTDDFALGETIRRQDDTSVQATVIKGPFDEIAHTRNSESSDVSLVVTRNPSSLEDSQGGGTDPVSTINIQLRAGVIENADVSASAAISQSKLFMNRAGTEADSSLMFGTETENTGQTYRGLAAFDDANFTEELKLTLNASITANAGNILYQSQKVGVVVNSVSNSTTVVIRTSDDWVPSGVLITKAEVDSEGVVRAAQALNVSVANVLHSGYIGLKDRSIGLTKLQLVNTDVVLGRFNPGSGQVEEVPFDTVVDQGFALQDKDFLNSANTLTTGQTITFAEPVTVSNGTIIEQDIGGLTVTGVVQGDVYSETKVSVVSTTGNFGTGAVSIQGGDQIGLATSSGSANLIGSALVKISEGQYATTGISTGSSAHSIVRRNSEGSLRATSYLIGGSDDNEIIELDANNNIRLKTISQGTILYAQGGNNAATPTNPVVNIPGNLDVGTTAVTQSVFQTNSNDGAQTPTNTFGGKGFISTNWIYAPFIEAPGERNGNSTGIGIGGNTGFGFADTVQVVAQGGVRLLVSSTGAEVTGALASSGALTSGGDFEVGNSQTGITFSVTASTGAFTGGAASVSSLSSSGAISGTTGTFTSDVSGANGTFTGDVQLGDGTTDTVTFNAKSTTILPTNSSQNIGSNVNPWGTVYGSTFSGTATSAKYADLAENYLADAHYEPGTVLVLGGDAEVTVTNLKADTRAAGVVTTNPAHLMNSALSGEHVVGVALAGRVPCKVLGRVKKGDILVTSAIPGYAIVDNTPAYGTIIGKAVSSKEDDGKGVVEVLVGKS